MTTTTPDTEAQKTILAVFVEQVRSDEKHTTMVPDRLTTIEGSGIEYCCANSAMWDTKPNERITQLLRVYDPSEKTYDWNITPCTGILSGKWLDDCLQQYYTDCRHGKLTATERKHRRDGGGRAYAETRSIAYNSHTAACKLIFLCLTGNTPEPCRSKDLLIDDIQAVEDRFPDAEVKAFIEPGVAHVIRITHPTTHKANHTEPLPMLWS